MDLSFRERKCPKCGSPLLPSYTRSGRLWGLVCSRRNTLDDKLKNKCDYVQEIPAGEEV